MLGAATVRAHQGGDKRGDKTGVPKDRSAPSKAADRLEIGFEHLLYSIIFDNYSTLYMIIVESKPDSNISQGFGFQYEPQLSLAFVFQDDA